MAENGNESTCVPPYPSHLVQERETCSGPSRGVGHYRATGLKKKGPPGPIVNSRRKNETDFAADHGNHTRINWVVHCLITVRLNGSICNLVRDAVEPCPQRGVALVYDALCPRARGKH